MKPWYKGYNGEIIKNSKGFESKGQYNVDLLNNILRITELPLWVWTR